MIINLKNLAKNETKEINFCSDITLSKDYVDINSANISIIGTIARINDTDYKFKSKVNSVLNVNCDLCLKPFKMDICFDVDEIFSSKDNYEQIYRVVDYVIDLEPIIRENLLINIPMKIVCSDNCKGLCPVCGQNLNEFNCKCKDSYINPQFEKLLTLFNEKEV